MASSQPTEKQRELSEKMQKVAMELQKIETELQSSIEVRQRLDSQLTENEQVKKVGHVFLQRKVLMSRQEFASLKEDDIVYKAIGPALLKQEQGEAKSNVEKRIEYIQSEMCVFARRCLLYSPTSLCIVRESSRSSKRSMSAVRRKGWK